LACLELVQTAYLAVGHDPATWEPIALRLLADLREADLPCWWDNIVAATDPEHHGTILLDLSEPLSPQLINAMSLRPAGTMLRLSEQVKRAAWHNNLLDSEKTPSRIQRRWQAVVTTLMQCMRSDLTVTFATFPVQTVDGIATHLADVQALGSPDETKGPAT